MKSFFLVIVFSIIIIGSQILAQVKDQQKLELLKSKYPNEYENIVSKANEMNDIFKQKQHIAFEWAKSRGYLTKGLIRLENRRPIYISDHNLNAAKTISTDKVWNNSTYSLNLDGSGVLVGIWDGGIPRVTHQEFTNSTIFISESDQQTEEADHATHVAGTIVAQGSFHKPGSKGMANKAIIHSYMYPQNEGDLSNYSEMLISSVDMSNHSYGPVGGWEYGDFKNEGIKKWYWLGELSQNEDYLFGYYNEEARSFDEVANQNKYHLIVLAAGNERDDIPEEGGNSEHYEFSKAIDDYFLTTTDREQDGGTSGFDCLAGNANSKNAIVVGAVEDITSGYQDKNDVILTEFSSTGPTDDGRIKPDIVANGRQMTSPCAFEDDENTIPSDDTYLTEDGTSFSAPSVTGSIALLKQHYKNTHTNGEILASTLKAIVLHTADEAGNDGPDYKYGWGLMNTFEAAKVISLDEDINDIDHYDKHYIRELKFDDNNDRFDIYVQTDDPSIPIKTTIAWTDIPGIVDAPSLDLGTKKLVHDLDIIVSELDVNQNIVVTNYPWILNKNSPSAPATHGDNTVDNVEQIVVQNPIAGVVYRISITNKGLGSIGEQEFSLIITGASEQKTIPELLVTPTLKIIDYEGGTFSLEIKNNGGGELNWTAATNDTWVHLSSELGTGDGTITVICDPYNGPDVRPPGKITIDAGTALKSPQVITIVQRALDQPGEITLIPSNYNTYARRTYEYNGQPAVEFNTIEGLKIGENSDTEFVGVLEFSIESLLQQLPENLFVEKAEFDVTFDATNGSVSKPFVVKGIDDPETSGSFSKWKQLTTESELIKLIDGSIELNEITNDVFRNRLNSALTTRSNLQFAFVGAKGHIDIDGRLIETNISVITAQTPPKLKIKYKGNSNIDQKSSDGNSFGIVKMWKDNTWTDVTVPSNKFIGGQVTLQADQEFKDGTSELFYRWISPTGSFAYVNHETFLLTEFENNITAEFKPTINNVTIRNLFDGFESINGITNAIKFKDPWLSNIQASPYGLKNGGNNAVFEELISPFNINQNNAYKGIFLNQTADLGPTYAVENSQIQNFNGRDFKFIEWTGSNVNFTNKANLSTSVIFSSDNAVVSALYKGIHSTNNPSTFSNPNQRKIIRTQNGSLHMVYESMGYVWYERSSDNGATWEILNGGKPVGEGSEPSLNGLFIDANLDEIIYVAFVSKYPGLIEVIKLTNGLKDNKTFEIPYPDPLLPIASKPIINIYDIDRLFVVTEFEQIGLCYAAFYFHHETEDIILTELNNTLVPDGVLYAKNASVSRFVYRENNKNYVDIAWEESGKIMYQKIENIGDNFIFPSSATILSDISGTTDNSKPIVNITEYSYQTSQPTISWIGMDNGVKKVISISKGENGSWNNVNKFGNNVDYLTTEENILNLQNGETPSDNILLAWKENNSPGIKYAKGINNNFQNVKTISANVNEFHLNLTSNDLQDVSAYFVNTASMPYSFESINLGVSSNEISLSANWNWTSFPVVPTDNSINNIFGTINYSDQDIVKSQFYYNQFLTGTGWVGSLNNIDFKESYKIWLSNPRNINISGDYIDAAANPLTIKPGFNWVGYFLDIPKSINDAFTNFTPAENDRILSQFGNSTYSSSTWIGSVSTLAPAEGYIYYSDTGQDRTFTWNNSQSQAAPESSNIYELAKTNYDLDLNPRLYSEAMYLIGELTDKEIGINDDIILSAFSGDECRGLGKPIFVEKFNKYLFFMNIYGSNDKNEKITFKLYDATSKNVYKILNNFDFEANKFLGDIKAPKFLSTSSAGENDLPTTYSLSANYPNPFNPETKIEFAVPKNDIVTIAVYNLLGEKIKTLTSKIFTPGYYSVYWSGKDEAGINVSSGIYFYRLISGDFIQSRKMILMK